jgi:osmoprotectant transport system substrate-binding protein
MPVALAAVCAACVSPSGRSPPSAGHPVITIGTFDFPESVLLAQIYGGALRGQGFPVRVEPDLGSRELVDPALMRGLIQLVPEYAGSALEFVSLGRLSATSDAQGTSKKLARSVAGAGLVAARPATAQDSNAIVVTAATAARYHLRSITDLARWAPRLVFGGPPECPGRPYCLPGLKHTYGLHFRKFVPLDAGGPLTLQALDAEDVDVALLFSTNPSIRTEKLVTLTDDRGLQPAENITPLVSRGVVAHYGPGLLAALNRVSARLYTGSLRAMDALVQLTGRDPRQVAGSWLRAQGLLPKEGAVR